MPAARRTGPPPPRDPAARHTAVVDFTAELSASGGTTTGFVVPEAVVDALGGGRRPKVVATLAGHSWRTSIAPMGGGWMLGVSAAVRAATGVAAGEVHVVSVDLDDAPRSVEVPDDLAAALAASPAASAAWSALSYSAQRRHAEAVLAAKKPETRARRVSGTVDALTTG